MNSLKSIIGILAISLTAMTAIAKSAPIRTTERHVLSLTRLFQAQSCDKGLQQFNGNEPGALCNVSVGIPGKVQVVAIFPMGLHDEFTSALSEDIVCTGGFQADANLDGQIQILVSLSPWRLTYTKAQLQECLNMTVSKLSAKDRVVHLDVTK